MNTLSCLDGNLILGVEQRVQGPSLHLIVRMLPEAPLQETRQFRQLWRADCFHEHAHEHLFTPTGEVIRELSGSDAEKPVDWCLTELTHLAGVFSRAGYPEIANLLSLPVPTVFIREIQDWMHEA